HCINFFEAFINANIDRFTYMSDLDVAYDETMDADYKNTTQGIITILQNNNQAWPDKYSSIKETLAIFAQAEHTKTNLTNISDTMTKTLESAQAFYSSLKINEQELNQKIVDAKTKPNAKKEEESSTNSSVHNGESISFEENVIPVHLDFEKYDAANAFNNNFNQPSQGILNVDPTVSLNNNPDKNSQSDQIVNSNPYPTYYDNNPSSQDYYNNPLNYDNVSSDQQTATGWQTDSQNDNFNQQQQYYQAENSNYYQNNGNLTASDEYSSQTNDVDSWKNHIVNAPDTQEVVAQYIKQNPWPPINTPNLNLHSSDNIPNLTDNIDTNIVSNPGAIWPGFYYNNDKNVDSTNNTDTLEKIIKKHAVNVNVNANTYNPY
ncbi:MAG: hypothetical protein ACK4PR_02260, partial [Gammaproteobacteria bacterium]